MKPVIKDLGKVCITPEGDWDIKKEYANLSIVFNRNDAKVYISKQCVPKNIDILNTDYWYLLVDFDSIVNDMTALEIKNYVDNAIKEYIGNVPYEYNSLEKISDWIKTLKAANDTLADKLKNLNTDIIELLEELANGSFLVGMAHIAEVVKNGAITFNMLDGKLQLSASVVDNLNTMNTLMPLSANQGKILKDLIDIINGKGEGSTDKKITDAIAKLVNNAPENLNTLRELADWIDDHGTEFAVVVADINNIKRDAVLTSSVHISQYNNKINIGGRSIDGAVTMSVDIPAATTVTAGVMSAEDKKSLDTATSRALRALFVAAGAEYNDTNTNKTKTTPWGETVQHLPKHYYLNGLGDITEEQMTEIYNAGRVMQGVPGIYNSNGKIRTNLPSIHATAKGYSKAIEGRGMFCACAKLEVAIFNTNKNLSDKIITASTDAQYVFYNCPKVRYISRLNLEGGTSTISMFSLCSSLSHVEIEKLSTNLSFSDSPLIDKESILYLIQNNKAKSAITITLHADAYARLAEDADIVAALEAQPLVTLVSA